MVTSAIVMTWSQGDWPIRICPANHLEVTYIFPCIVQIYIGESQYQFLALIATLSVFLQQFSLET